MRPTRHIILILLFALSDILIFNLSLLGAMVIALSQNQNNGITQLSALFANSQISYIIFFLATNLLLLLTDYILKNDQRLIDSPKPSTFQHVNATMKTVAACLMHVFILSKLLNIQTVTISCLNYFIILFIISLYIQRFVLKRSLSLLRILGYNNRTIAIVGINDRSIEFVEYLEQNKSLGFNILGFIDDEHQQSNHNIKHSVICNIKGFQDFIRHNTIDEISIFLPVKSKYDTIQKIINTCQEHGILVRYSSNIFNVAFALPTKFSSVQENNFILITMITGQIEGWRILLKRLFDIIISIILLVMLSPLFFIVMIAIKMSSPGSAFFVQQRIGLNKRKFGLYKFRTMVVDAENQLDDLSTQNEAAGPVFKIKNDPRIIPIGFFLRKSSIDELPQLLNVLLGDLSLVGPRPLPIRDFEGFYKDSHRRRFSVKPGITCTWQIQGRHDISFEEWMRLDLKYIDEWSLWLDFKILLGTIPAVLNFSKAS